MRRTRDLARGAAFAGLLAIALAACSGYQAPDGDNGQQPQQAQPQQAQPQQAQPQQQGAPAQADAAVVKVVNSRFGQVLADASGRTLYGFTKDVKGSGRSSCNGQCIATWPALTASGTPLAGAGVQAAMLGTIQRDDGTTQVTYGDWPLYYFANDETADDVNGQGVGDVWYVVSPDGSPLQDAGTAAGGGYGMGK
jgi:predicted lipoprotein with Yx(FWY)xxD motif